MTELATGLALAFGTGTIFGTSSFLRESTYGSVSPPSYVVYLYLEKYNVKLPFLINKLVTLRSASRGDFWKNLGVRFGGRVSGLRAPVPSHATGWSTPILDDVVSLSKCSVDAGLEQK